MQDTPSQVQGLAKAFSMFPWYLWVMVGVSAVAFVIVRVVPFFRSAGAAARKVKYAAKVAMSDMYPRHPKDPGLTGRELQVLSVGALGSLSQNFYVNTLATGGDKKLIAEGLREWWGIEDAASAVARIESLRAEGHRLVYDRILAVAHEDPQIWATTALEANLGDEAVAEAVRNFVAAVPLLTRKGVLAKDHPSSALAWDMGRVGFLARACLTCGYIDESQAQRYLESAYEAAAAQYGTWAEFANAYLIGRAFWVGADAATDSMIPLAQGLVGDAESPWQQVPLRS